MKVGFDAKRIFHNHTGLGNYSRGLVRDLVEFYGNYEVHLFTPKEQEITTNTLFQGLFPIHTASVKPSWYWRTFKMVKDIEKQGIDIYHGLTHELPRGIEESKVKGIVTVHDLIFKVYPKQYKRLDTLIYNWKLQYACEAADIIIAISEHTKKDIIKYYDIPAEKIKVIYQTCDASFKIKRTPKIIAKTLQKHDLPEDYLLYVGSIIERKNLLLLVQAMEKLTTEIPLVVVGNGKVYKKKIVDYIEKNNLKDRVIFLENVMNEDLPSLYQQAKIFIYPSLYEGFGIPIIEAIFSETPVITTSESALPEAGGSFSNYVTGLDAKELSDKIEEVLSSPSKNKIAVEKSLEYAESHFAPEITAKKLHQLYQAMSRR